MKDAPSRTPARFSFAVVLGVSLVMTAAIINAVWSIRAVNSVIDRNRSVEHTRIVQDELDGTMIALLNMESGERGYLYSGEQQFLEPYVEGKSAIAQHLDRFTQLTSDNPVQQQDVRLLRSQVADLMALWQQAIDLAPSANLRKRQESELGLRAKGAMDGIRSLIGRMEGEENRLLADRIAAARSGSRYLLLAIPAAQALALILIVLAGWLIRRDLSKRMAAAAQYRQLAARERAAREQAESSRQLLDLVLASISEMFLLVDKEWRIRYVNQQVLRTAGKPPDQIVGCSLWDVYSDILGTEFENCYRLAMETQTPQSIESFY